MANGTFDNPYMTQGNLLDPTVSGQVQYRGDDRVGGYQGGDRYRFRIGGDDRYRTSEATLSDLGYDPIQGYEYNMGSSIMDTLSDVFDMEAGGFDITDYFGVEDLSSMGQALQEQAGTMTTQVADYEQMINSGYYHAPVSRELGGEFVGDPTFSFEEGVDGPSGALAFTNIFDKQSLADTLSAMAGIEPGGEPIKASEVTALTPEMIEKTESAYYDPLLESTQEEATFNLADALSRDVSGGFAGGGAGVASKQRAKRAYGKNIQNILSQILKSKASATADVNKRIMGWQELLDI